MVGAHGFFRFVKKVWRALPVDGVGLSRGGPIEARRLRAFVSRSFWRRYPWWARPLLIPAARAAWVVACPVKAAQALRRAGRAFRFLDWARLTVDGWRWGCHPAWALAPEFSAALFRPIMIETVHQKLWGLMSRWLGSDEDVALARDKLSLAAALRALGVATPEVLREIPMGAAVDAGELPWPKSGALFIKQRHGSRGVGAISVAPLPGGKFLANASRVIDKPELERILTRTAARDALLVQRHVSPSPAFSDISPHEPVQLRIFVVRRPGGEPFVHSCFAKILQRGRYGAVAPSGALAAAVDPATGRIGLGVLVSVSEHLHSTVPWNGAQIEGRMIADYPAAVAAVLTGSRALADLPIIGWDVLLTDSGPVVLEANTSLAWNYLHLRQAFAGEGTTLAPLIMEWLDFAESRRGRAAA